MELLLCNSLCLILILFFYFPYFFFEHFFCGLLGPLLLEMSHGEGHLISIFLRDMRLKYLKLLALPLFNFVQDLIKLMYSLDWELSN